LYHFALPQALQTRAIAGVQPVGYKYYWQARKILLYLDGQPLKGFSFAILLVKFSFAFIVYPLAGN
jgi:hypothetical protein